jgi:hypothetical protein
MKQNLQWSSALLVMSLLAGCAAPGRMAPVESRTTGPQSAPADPALESAPPSDPSVSVIAVPAPDPATGVPRPLTPEARSGAPEPLPPVAITAPLVRTAAVDDLLREVRRQWAAGQHDQAAAGLERALRIEPTNPYLWQHLAAVRLDQGRPQQAEQFAAKSNSMAGNSAPLRLRNWRLIAEARRRAGNVAGAREAEARAARYETAR